MAKRFIINEYEDNFSLVDKKTKTEIFTSKSFDDVEKEAKAAAGGEVVYGITHIKDPSARHPKFKSFKIPVRCSYEFE